MASYIAQEMRKRGYAMDEEPQIRTASELRKPDIVAKLGQTALVIDTQVVNDQIDLDTEHAHKREIYRGIAEDLKQKYAVSTVEFTSVTLSRRGVWSGASAAELLGLGVIRKNALKVLSSRVIIGGLAAFHCFNRATSIGERCT